MGRAAPPAARAAPLPGAPSTARGLGRWASPTMSYSQMHAQMQANGGLSMNPLPPTRPSPVHRHFSGLAGGGRAAESRSFGGSLTMRNGMSSMPTLSPLDVRATLLRLFCVRHAMSGAGGSVWRCR